MSDRKDIAPGVYPGVARAEYDAWPFASYSMLKGILPPNTPAKWRYNRDHPRDPSKAMQEGDWIDSLLYSRERLERDFVRRPDDAPIKRGKDNMLWWAKFEAESAGKSVIEGELYDQAEEIVEAFYRHEVARVIEDAGFDPANRSEATAG